MILFLFSSNSHCDRPMAKRHASTLTASQARKRKRNGVSASRSVLDSTDLPLDLDNTMCVWSSKAQNIRNRHKSLVPLQPEASNVQLEDLVLEQAEDIPTGSATGIGERKTKSQAKRKVNDSVSHSNIIFTLRGIIRHGRQRCRIGFTIGCRS